MLLRPRQKKLVDCALIALRLHGNTLAVAPTGAGKTIMLSAIIGELWKGSRIKACVLAHRDELTAQNQAKFQRVNPHIPTSLFDASVKSWDGHATFAMVQTLCRQENLATMPPLDLLVIDEAHHACSDSYLRIVDWAKAISPKVQLLGMTATPHRGDKKGLDTVFCNVCDQITVGELIASGHLVTPKVFVMDLGIRERLKGVRKIAQDYDMREVAEIMDVRPLNEAVVAHWKEKAGDRQTVVFCSTVDHARHVHESFCQAGVSAVLVHGGMSASEREDALATYTSGIARVIVNVAVLLEGWDHPPTSCVVLLRPSSYKSTFIQMVGRGLRPVTSEEYPGVIKNDCFVLDFGTAALTHGLLEQKANLEGESQGDPGEAPCKTCPQCNLTVSLSVRECPECGFGFTQDRVTDSLGKDEFSLTELDPVTHFSPFMWVEMKLRDMDRCRLFMAAGFQAWSGVFSYEGQWCAVGALSKEPAKLLLMGDKATCFAAANDWMNFHETDDSAHKAKRWLNLPPTEKQLGYLPEQANGKGLTRYKASVLLNLKFNAQSIERAIRPIFNKLNKKGN